MRIGFIIGKEDDDNVRKSSMKLLPGIPDEFKNEKGVVDIDVAVPYFISLNYNVDVDIIKPGEMTKKRLLNNDINFCIGFDLITAAYNHGSKVYNLANHVFRNWKSFNIYPSWKLQNFIYEKGSYLKKLEKAGIPVAPTIDFKGGRVTKKRVSALIDQIQKKGWEQFIIKPQGGAWSDGIVKLSTEEVSEDPKILTGYFKQYKFKSYVIQEVMKGFAKFWEIRLFWYNGKFAYAIANKAPPATGADEIVAKKLPSQVAACKKIGRKLLKLLPKVGGKGHNKPPVILRTDFGCCQGNTLDKNKYFLNEMELQACNWFTRHTPYPVLEKASAAFVKKSRELSGKKISKVKKPRKSTRRPKKASRKRSKVKKPRRSNRRPKKASRKRSKRVKKSKKRRSKK